MASIKDVARRSGVARATVSRVITNRGYVSAETRRRVEAAIQELNYIPNALGPSLHFKRTQTLALVLPDITGPFFGAIARGAEDAANRLGYHIILGNTDESDEKLEDYLLFLAKKQVDGFVFVPTSQDVPKTLQKHRIPFVTVDRQVNDDRVDAVRADSVGGAFQLTKHLIELGHRRIAVINGPQDVSTACDRAAGVIRAFEAAGFPEPPEIFWSEWSESLSYDRTKQLLTTVPRPTAIFATNNNLFVGVIRAIWEAKLRVPEDISLVGFDDIPPVVPSVLMEPLFTVAVQPTYEIGRRAVELLVARLEGKDADEYHHIILPVDIIVRKSSGKPPDMNLDN